MQSSPLQSGWIQKLASKELNMTEVMQLQQDELQEDLGARKKTPGRGLSLFVTSCCVMKTFKAAYE